MTTYFTDRDLGKSFATSLAGAGLDVVMHQEVFDQACPDETWLAEVGRRGWVALTHDQRIRYKTNELAAVMRNDVRLLVLIGKVPHALLAQNFVATIRQVEAFLARHAPPFIAKVYRPPVTSDASTPGSVVLWKR